MLADIQYVDIMIFEVVCALALSVVFKIANLSVLFLITRIYVYFFI